VAASTGLSALVIQLALYRQAPEGAVPLETGGVPAPEASALAARLQRIVSASVALFGSLVAVTTVMSQEG
jgi:hypothetical protein